ncbi:MAG: hypothetical protein IJM64_03425 [Ottowia sp.]|nr:hypothetical protein [Ottowia sp.]
MNKPDKGGRNIAASVRARLLNRAHAEKLPVLTALSAGDDFNQQWRADAGWVSAPQEA